MIRAFHATNALRYRFLSYVGSRNIRIEEGSIDKLCQGSERRLAMASVLLARQENQCKQHTFDGTSQWILAKMTGSTRGRVNFFMNRFRTLGFIGHISTFN
jgi:CRP/FNR family cyclic AMP-dependent transcriptional regulator